MTHSWIRTALLGLSTTGLATVLVACGSTPAYPINPGEARGTGPQRAQPAYAITKSDAPPPAPRVDEEGNAMPPAQPTTPVDRGSLAPITSQDLPPPPKPRPQGIAYRYQDAPLAEDRADVSRRIFGDLADGAGDGEGDFGLIRVATHHHAVAAPTREEAKLRGEEKKPKKAAKAAKPEPKGKKGRHAAAEPEPKGRRGHHAAAAEPEAKPRRGRRAAAVEAPEPKASPGKAVPGVIAGGAVVAAAGPPTVYTVKKGDTLDSIARRMGITRKALQDENDLSSHIIKPGLKLKGPQSKAKAYVVQSGDTLAAIARRFSVDPADIADENDMKVSAALRPGKKLVLPEGFKDRGVPKPPKPAAPAPTRPSRSVVVPAEPDYNLPGATLPNPPPYQPAPYKPPVSQPPVTRPTPSQPAFQAPAGVEVPGNPEPTKPYRQVPSTTTPGTAAPGTGSSGLPSRPQPYVPPVGGVVPPSRPQMVDTTPPPADAEIASLGKGRFDWPVRGDLISDYGPKGGGQRNDGIDIRAAAGTAVRAAADGEVVYAGDQVPGFGNLVLIKHADGWVTAYAHLARTDVKMRQTVLAGAQIGQVGTSGGVTEPQLHFEVRYSPSTREKARAVNPMLVLPRQ